jgi:hypothetical protein
MDNDERIKRGNEAGRILKSALWAEAWATYRTQVFAAIENAKSDEATIRGKLMLGVMNDVRKVFEGMLKDGEFNTAEVKLTEERKRLWPFAS